MRACLFEFDTKSFKDDPQILATNVNEFGGHSFATWLTTSLEADNCTASEVWDEDHGWDFFVSNDEGKYLCACQIYFDDAGEPTAGHVVLSKDRSFLDALFGRNKLSESERIIDTIRSVLESSRDVDNVGTHLE